jgi:hypothetical protein
VIVSAKLVDTGWICTAANVIRQDRIELLCSDSFKPAMGQVAVAASVASVAVASVALAAAWGNLFPVMAASGAA